MLAGGDDSERLQSLIDDDNTRFDAVKNSARERSNSLDEALQQAAEVTRIYSFHSPTPHVMFSVVCVCNSLCPRGGVLMWPVQTCLLGDTPPRTYSSLFTCSPYIYWQACGCKIVRIKNFKEAEIDINICSYYSINYSDYSDYQTCGILRWQLLLVVNFM